MKIHNILHESGSYPSEILDNLGQAIATAIGRPEEGDQHAEYLKSIDPDKLRETLYPMYQAMANTIMASHTEPAGSVWKYTDAKS